MQIKPKAFSRDTRPTYNLFHRQGRIFIERQSPGIFLLHLSRGSIFAPVPQQCSTCFSRFSLSRPTSLSFLLQHLFVVKAQMLTEATLGYSAGLSHLRQAHVGSPVQLRSLRITLHTLRTRPVPNRFIDAQPHPNCLTPSQNVRIMNPHEIG